MKRHPSLAHFSRDHHGALLLARLLQKNAPAYKGMPTDLAGKAIYAAQFYTDELVKHFLLEEKVYALVTGVNDALDLLVQTVLRQHCELNVLFAGIGESQDLETALDSIGKALEMHIRKEERELFPLIQESCDAVLMDQIEASLTIK